MQDVPYTKKFLDKANKSEEFLSLFRGITQDPAGKGTVPTIIGRFVVVFPLASTPSQQNLGLRSG